MLECGLGAMEVAQKICGSRVREPGTSVLGRKERKKSNTDSEKTVTDNIILCAPPLRRE